MKKPTIQKTKRKNLVFLNILIHQLAWDLITEIICNKTIRGEKLPESIIYFLYVILIEEKLKKLLITIFVYILKKNLKIKI